MAERNRTTPRSWMLLAATTLMALGGLASCTSDKTVSGGRSDMYIANGGDGISRCSARIGAVAITEADTNAQALTSAGLPRSMAPLVRQLLMQSRCFAVVERGAAFAALENEIKIREQQGQDRAHQMAAMTPADYVIRAEIVFVEQTGGNKGALGAVVGSILGGMGAETRTREALVVMSAIDARTSEIVAASFGRGTNETEGMGSIILGGGLVALQAGWLDTPQAKPVAAALADAWNKLLPKLSAARTKASDSGLRETAPSAALATH
jgi:curli biogenesis system outer membrane secretion channel CsgG